jgi:patatin-like phospholipase/acyl hydrolase
MDEIVKKELKAMKEVIDQLRYENMCFKNDITYLKDNLEYCKNQIKNSLNKNPFRSETVEGFGR